MTNTERIEAATTAVANAKKTADTVGVGFAMSYLIRAAEDLAEVAKDQEARLLRVERNVHDHGPPR